jgi:hypothetical protein
MTITITLNLDPDIEQGLLAQAQAKGVSITDYVEQIVEREARQAPLPNPAPTRRTGQDLIDACAKVRGLLTDEEIDRLFSRTPSTSRPVDFS